MNISIEIFKRNIKLQELGIDKLSKKEQKILYFLEEHLSNLNLYSFNEGIDEVFIGKDIDNIIIKYNYNNNFLFVEYNKIFKILYVYFKEKEINDLLKWWFIEVQHIDIIISYTFVCLIEENFNNIEIKSYNYSQLIVGVCNIDKNCLTKVKLNHII